ncbi:MAG: hypothetical protein U1E50_01435 [Caulobacteraceae bacterium]
MTWRAAGLVILILAAGSGLSACSSKERARAEAWSLEIDPTPQLIGETEHGEITVTCDPARPAFDVEGAAFASSQPGTPQPTWWGRGPYSLAFGTYTLRVEKPVEQNGTFRLIFVEDGRPLSAADLAQIQGAEEMVFTYQGGEWRITTAPDALRAKFARACGKSSVAAPAGP